MSLSMSLFASRALSRSLLSLGLGLVLGALGCARPGRPGAVVPLQPEAGQAFAEVQGETARLRIYALPPGGLPDLPGVLAVYVELRNTGAASLRVSYPDLWIGDGRVARFAPIRPGDLLRPSGLARGAGRLLASNAPTPFFGRRLGGEPPPRPETLSDWETRGTSLDFFSPTARTHQGNWVMRNDYDTGMHLTTAGWPFFGLPKTGGAMSLFDLLQGTLPDGALLPGNTMNGLLFFPAAAVAFTGPGGAALRWDVHAALDDNAIETLSLPIRAGKNP